jgi:hypothetical protein
VDSSPDVANLRPVDEQPELQIPATMQPAARERLLSALADEGAGDLMVQALGAALVERARQRLGRDPTDRERLQALLDGLHELVQYRPDPAGQEVFNRVVWTFTPRPFNPLSPLSGKPKGQGDCEDFATAYAALARAQGLDAHPRWVDQPGSTLNHVAAVSCGLADVEFRPSGCAWVETSIAGAQVGETTDQALERHGSPLDRPDLVAAGAPDTGTRMSPGSRLAWSGLAGAGAGLVARRARLRRWQVASVAAGTALVVDLALARWA